MGITKKLFGKTPLGSEVYEYTMTNSKGMEVSVLNYGCIITKISVPDKNGKNENVVLSYDTLEEYEDNPAYLGCIVGRYAGRISGSRICIDGTDYYLDKNSGDNSLHGGYTGFGRVLWQVTEIAEKPFCSLKLNYISKDSEGGFPGDLNVTTTYNLKNDNSLEIIYEAVSNKKTAISLTNHSYFNLSGSFEPVINHHLRVTNPKVLELNPSLLITGKIMDLRDYGLDSLKKTTIKDYMDTLQKITPFYGIDHPFIVDRLEGSAVEYAHRENGRHMTVYTDLPYMNIYSGNYLNNNILEGSAPYSGICFETSEQPDGPNNQSLGYRFLEANEPYRASTLFRFNGSTKGLRGAKT